MFFPLSDDDRHLAKPAFVTYALLAANIAVWFLQLMNPALMMSWSVVPLEITSGKDLVGIFAAGGEETQLQHLAGPSPIYLSLISSMFMHGSWMHLGGNMLYLWIFGDNIEHRFGHGRFLFFYLVSGLVASATQILMAPESIIPNVGASGAIAGILGAYLVLFPRNKVNALFFVRIISVPAIVVLGMWIALQIYQGYGSLHNVGQSGGVAYGAHIGGFVAGVIFAMLSRIMMKQEPVSVLQRQYVSDPTSRRIW